MDAGGYRIGNWRVAGGESERGRNWSLGDATLLCIRVWVEEINEQQQHSLSMYPTLRAQGDDSAAQTRQVR